MDSIIILVIITVVAAVAGFVAGYFISVNKTGTERVRAADARAKEIIEDAQKDSENVLREKMLEVKDESMKRKRALEEESTRRKEKLQNFERQLKLREENIEKNLNKKLETATRREKELLVQQKEMQKKMELVEEKSKAIEQQRKQMDNVKATIDQQKKMADELLAEQNHRLERISGMSKEDARKFLIENMVNDAKLECAQELKTVRDQLKLDAKREAQRVIVQAIQRTASDHSVETTVSVVNLASEDMKGRIIGREGRNIRAFEAATGIDVIVDDTPEAVIISGFDPFRREVAKIALERLMQDGRIHPARIEEIVDKVRKELEEEIIRVGNNACLELGINNVHAEIIKLIGRMKYRSSYGQNVLSHSIEVAYLCSIMARELGLDVNHAKRAGLMHDMGKCVDRNIEGPHALLGYDIAKRYKEHPVVCNAIGAHHEDIEMETPIAVLVQAADAISGARPGARRESLEAYVKRLETLETLARSFEGVAKTYAIQAGREVRVMVEPDRVDDLFADQLSHDIAHKIQQEMEYPGQIKVTVIRERRSVSFAK
ncbi:MAG: 2,3-cyclic-nucleotide 2-phosphodiesterase [Chlorobi bacterium]|nr:2,3-cyclic-nucleotide 2-phosphodiesterase [Chlorobiota bacterium]